MRRRRPTAPSFPVLIAVAWAIPFWACSEDPAEPSPEGDLVIRYIQRLPEMRWVPHAADPTRDGWPAPGQEVTWAAHVLNGAPAERPDVGYRWVLDGEVLETGTVDLPADGEAVVSLPWPWTFDRHRLAFEIDPGGVIDAVGEVDRNNRLEVYTDALSVGFWVERSLYDLMAANQPALGIGSTSFEDFANRQIRYYNEMFEDAVWPETPDGVLDRYRLDKVVVVSDGALPLVAVTDPGFDPPQAVPDMADSTVDLMWGFPASVQSVYSRGSNQADFSGFVQHELGHARYLIDVYGLSVYQGTAGDSVEILEAGARVAGSAYMPGRETVYNGEPGLSLYTAQRGLMHAQWSYVDRHSAGAMNRIAGHRATAGSWNEPGNIGEYLTDLPAENRLQITADGAPLAGATVQVYRSERHPVLDQLDGIYRKHFDNVPDMERVADADGRVTLGRNPFADGPIVHTEEFVNGVVIVRVEHQGRVGYGFLDVTSLNQAYWRGDTEVADHTLAVDLIAP